MTYTASTIKNNIEDKLSEVKSEYNKLTRLINSTESEISTLTEEKENIYAKIANIYLPQAEAQKLRGDISTLQGEVKKIFAERTERRNKINNIIEQTNNSIDSNKEKLSLTASELNTLADNKRAIEINIENTLNQQENYLKALDDFNQKNREYTQGKNRLNTVSAQSKNQISTYENNKLFKYLIDRKFNTAEYKGNMITTWFDEKIATFINFKNQEETYQFLKRTPKLLEKEVLKLEDEAKKSKMKIDELYNSEAEKQGLNKVIIEFRDKSFERENILQEQSSLKRNLEDNISEMRELDTNKSDYHIEVVRKLKSYLKGYSIQELIKQAQATPDSEDDILVKRIETIDSNIRNYKDSIIQLKTKQNSVSTQLSRIENLEHIFESKYEGGKSRFQDGLDIDRLLAGVLIGTISTNNADNTLNQYHYKEPEITHSYDRTNDNWNRSSHNDDNNSWNKSSHHNNNDDDDTWSKNNNNDNNFGNWGGGSDSGISSGGGTWGGGGDNGF